MAKSLLLIFGVLKYKHDKQGPNEPVPNYFGIGSLATIDPEAGIFYAFIENNGYYTFAIQVSSYRNGILMDRVVRDMKIPVEFVEGENDRPALQLNTPLLLVQDVSVGDTVRFQANIQDDNTAVPAGAYLLQYEIGGQRWQQRFVVQ